MSSAYRSIFWACLSSWYYGYHLSELNFPFKSLTCLPLDTDHGPLRPCLGLTPFIFSTVTAMLTVGGLIGSLLSDRVVRSKGVAGGIAWSGWLNLLGAAVMSLSPHWTLLMLGRFVSGLACGLAVCLVPPFLNMMARTTPSLTERSGQVGTLHQLAIVLGICSAQVLGMLFSGADGDRANAWRYILAISGLVSLVQIAMTRTKATDTEGSYELRAALTSAEPLLDASERAEPEQLSVQELLAGPARKAALFVTAILVLQQLSGVNAVLFYSTPVLQKVLPSAGAGQISIAITVVNAVMTFPAILLVDRLGRRTLLFASSFLMMSMAVLLGWGLNEHFKKTCSFAIVAFIAAFSIGLGPIPFLLVSEMVPPEAVPALSSLALSASWITTFIIAQGFLPLRDALTYYDPNGHQEGEGRVFYVFAVNLAILCVLTLKGVPKKTQVLHQQ